ncbi:hypothetical protein AB6N24_08855 [Cellulomonas sp. 179-A 4D5 NHS]|uniref:hypothetical protein n=1 Tax=Cellulomonas sp. 179-A 4D5 NHS TaxID=3142378 RepID=UPI00399FEFA6
MVQVVIQPSFGNADARRHWADTLEREVDFTSAALSNALTTSQRRDLVKMHPAGTARFWGTVASHDRRMDTLATGDVILFTGKKHVQGIGEVGVSFRNAAAADALWSADPDRGSYHNVYSLRAFEITQIPYEEIWALPGFNAGDNFMGTRFLDDERSQTVLEGLGVDTTTSHEADARHERILEHVLSHSAATVIPGEAINVTHTSYATGARTTLVHRGEALLVRAYAAHVELEHQRIATPVGLTDAYLPNATGGMDLLEAKSSTSRRHVREAVGQLLDYAPFCPDLTSLSILLPERPDQRTMAYAHRYGIDVAYRLPDGGFHRDPAPSPARAVILGLVSPQPARVDEIDARLIARAGFPRTPEISRRVAVAASTRVVGGPSPSMLGR